MSLDYDDFQYKDLPERVGTENILSEPKEKEKKSRIGEFIPNYRIFIPNLIQENKIEELKNDLKTLAREIKSCSNEQLMPLFDVDFLNVLISLHQYDDKEIFGCGLSIITSLLEANRDLSFILLSDDLIPFWNDVLIANEPLIYPFMVGLIATLSETESKKTLQFADTIISHSMEMIENNQIIDGNTVHYINSLIPIISENRHNGNDSLDAAAIVTILNSFPIELSNFNYTCREVCLAFERGIKDNLDEFISAFFENDYHSKFISMIYDESRITFQMGYRMLRDVLPLYSAEDLSTPEFIELSRIQTHFKIKIDSTRMIILSFLLEYIDRCNDIVVEEFFQNPDPFILDIINSLNCDSFHISEKASLLISKLFARASCNMLLTIDLPSVIQSLISFLDPSKLEFSKIILNNIQQCFDVVNKANLLQDVLDNVDFSQFDELTGTSEDIDTILEEIHKYFPQT